MKPGDCPDCQQAWKYALNFLRVLKGYLERDKAEVMLRYLHDQFPELWDDQAEAERSPQEPREG